MQINEIKYMKALCERTIQMVAVTTVTRQQHILQHFQNAVLLSLGLEDYFI